MKNPFCMYCKHHWPPEDGFMCNNEESKYFGCFRNDYKTCEKWEEEEEEEDE